MSAGAAALEGRQSRGVGRRFLLGAMATVVAMREKEGFGWEGLYMSFESTVGLGLGYGIFEY